MKSSYDAVIIGAGLAGWSLAFTLRQNGWSVLVVDQAKFPRDKVCGGFLGVENQPWLQSWGLWDDLVASGLRAIQNIRLVAASSADICWSGPDASPVGFGVSRRCLDEIFREKALEKGIHFRDASVLNDHQHKGRIHELKFLDRSAHENFSVRARVVVDAAGAEKIREQSPQDLVGAYALFDNIRLPANQVGLYLADGGHAGVNPFENGLTNICYVVSRRTFERNDKSLQKSFEHLKTQNRVLHDAVAGAEMKTSWKAVTVARRKAFRFYEDGVFYCGDATAVIHPIVGGGMTLALQSGVLLGRILASFDAGRLNPQEVLQEYRRSFVKQFGLRLKTSWPLGRLAHHSVMANAMISMGASGRAFADMMFRFNHQRSSLAELTA